MMCALLLMSACCHNEQPDDERFGRTVIVYMEAANSLYSFACTNIDTILCHASEAEIGSDNRLLIYFNGSPHHAPRLLEVTPAQEKQQKRVADTVLVKSYQEENTLTPAFMTQVLKDAREAYPSDSYGLVLWSHSQGWLPKESFTRSTPRMLSAPANGVTTKWFGIDYDYNALDITELRSALELYEWDYVLMDACYGACVEALYELRNCCDYWVGSPVEVMGNGFPYHKILPSLFAGHTESGLLQICRTYIDFYKKDSSYPSATVSLIQMDELDALAEQAAALVEVCDAARLSAPCFDSIQVLDNCKPAYFYDLDGYLRSAVGYSHADTLPETRRTEVVKRYQAFRQQLDRAVLYHDHTPYFYSGLKGSYTWTPISHSFCGLSAYIPRTDWPSSPSLYNQASQAYGHTSWAQAIGTAQH